MIRETNPGNRLMNTNDIWQIDAGLCSGPGRIRRLQEDAWYFGTEQFKPPDGNVVRKNICMPADSGGALFAVFDGIGDGKQGKEAAQAAAEWTKYLARLSDRGLDLKKTLPEWSSILNQKIRRDYPGAGTTMAMACFSGRTVRIAHIGNSRIYRVHEGTFEQLTRDHTQAELMLRHGLITPEEALIHPSRHTLCRYLGMENNLIETAIQISPFFSFRKNDRYILCTDGIYEMIPEEALKTLSLADGNAMSCADLLYREAMAEGGRDNLTVIVCEVRNPSVRGSGNIPLSGPG